MVTTITIDYIKSEEDMDILPIVNYIWDNYNKKKTEQFKGQQIEE